MKRIALLLLLLLATPILAQQRNPLTRGLADALYVKLAGSDTVLGTVTFTNVTITGTCTGCGAGSGTVSTLSVVSANGFAGSVANATTTPAITLTTTVTGLVKGNGTAFSAATAGTDYVAPGGALGTPSSGTLTNASGLPTTGLTGTLQPGQVPAFTGDATNTAGSLAMTVAKLNGVALSGLATGILKNTTGTGAPSIAVAGDFPTLNQNTTGTASNVSGAPALPNGTTATTQSASDNSTKLATTAYADRAGFTPPTGTGVVTVTSGAVDSASTAFTSNATASTVASRDSSANTRANSHIDGYTTTATAAGTTTLTVASTKIQFFTGSSNQTVVLPVASTLALGQEFKIVNLGTGTVTVTSSGSNSVLSMTANNVATFTCVLASGTTAASWQALSFARTDIAPVFPNGASFNNTLSANSGISFNNINNALNFINASELIKGAEKTLLNNTATGFATFTVPSDQAIGGTIFYTVSAYDSVNHKAQSTTGHIRIAAINENGTVTPSSVTALDVVAVLSAATTDTVSFDTTTSSNTFTVRVTSNTSLTTTLHRLEVVIVIQSPQGAVTML